ncbi:coiled-coil domain-containing protein 77 [Halyomorpha halys]|uniref:coiled-coil domain-containing protein 77 n=1 Tax=Halyomorpha halys TaxID=286706 RepID=UPI0006D4E30E|nr:coiled-coil domain-containing protein 77-like [Halyomorpha halys]
MPKDDPLHPSEKLLEFYKDRLLECRSQIIDLRKDVETCQRLAEQSAAKEDDAVRILADTSALQENLSELQSCLYREKEHSLHLKRENDKLELEKFEDKRKIAYLLQVAGMKESEIDLEERARKILGKSPRKRVRFREVKNFNKSIQDFKEETLTEVLQLKVEALEAELKEQTTLLKEELISQSNDFDLRKKEWEAQKKIYTQQISCLNSRLRNAQQFKFTEMGSYLEELDKVRQRDLKLIEDNDKLKRSLAICKELLGSDYPNERAKKAEISLKEMREQVEQRDKLVKEYQDQNVQLLEQMRLLKRELENEKELRQKDKERLIKREEYYKSKMEEEKKRRLLETEGFTADVKLLRSRLQSVERQIRQDRLRNRVHKEDT